MGHRLGQVFLHDLNIVRKIISQAGIQLSDHVVEIGCGEGVLTEALLPCSKKLTVIELDPSCIEQTKERLGDTSQVMFVQADVLKNGFDGVDAPKFKIVANLPYYISAKIMKLFINARHRIDEATVMLQQEFAQKLLATPGSDLYTSLTVYLSFFYEVRKGFKVSKTCFKPVPKVDSAVITLIPREKPLFDVDEDLFFNMVRSAFWGRRKPLLSALKKSPYLNLGKEIATCAFFEKNSNRRGETMSLADFHDLYLELFH